MMKNKKKFGFTLIEIVVVVAAVGLLMTAVISIVISAMKLQNQTKASSKLASNGTEILEELKKNILNASKNNISCSGDKSTLTMVNINDGESISLTCRSQKIASISATTVFLNNGDITVTDCSNFVSCSTLPSLEISNVKLNFGIGTSVSGIGMTRYFDLDVTIRN